MPVRQKLDIHGIVEVLGGLAVNGNDVEATEIFPAGDLFVWDHPRYGTGLLQHVLRKAVRNVVGADEDLDVHAKIGVAAVDLRDAAHWAFAVLAEIENVGGYDHP